MKRNAPTQMNFIRRAPSTVLGLLLGLSVLLAGGCVSSEVIDLDEGNKREVRLLTGTDLPEPLPSEAMRSLSTFVIDASLRRITVSPATWSTLVLDDPTYLLDKSQREWISGHLAARLPTLQPDQRLQFTFRDRFKNYLVELEIHPEGDRLVYSFNQLAAKLEDVERKSNERASNWATLVELPGQTLATNLRAFVLTDLVASSDPDQGKRRTEKFDLIRTALETKLIDPDEGKRLSHIAESLPHITVDDLRSYMNKRATLKKALDQELFDKGEFDSRREKLLKELER